MENHNFYQVQGWMVNNLKLRGNELICYAVIFSFCQDEESKYMGGVKYLQGWMNASEPTVISVLDKLSDKGLIEAIPTVTKTGKRVYYQVTKESLVRGNLRNLSKGTKESLGSLYNNNNNSIDNNKKRECDKSPSPKKVFVKPTVEQVEAYVKEKGYHFDAEQFWNHYESVGWMIGKNHMKDWHCACATWEGRRKQEQKEKEEKEEIPDEIPAADIAPWKGTKKWMAENTPSLVDRINYRDFAEMRGYACFNSKLFADILRRIHASG